MLFSFFPILLIRALSSIKKERNYALLGNYYLFVKASEQTQNLLSEKDSHR